MRPIRFDQKTKKPKVTEHALTLGIRHLLNVHSIWHFKHWSGGREKGPRSIPGVADIIGCHNGRMFAIEVKTERGRVTPYQQRFIDRVNDAGGLAFVARSIEDVTYHLGIGPKMKTNQ